ncbi:hypothetical protein CN327_21680 [Bacillus cereus]|nr:hypothetical protein CN327_21680 [Bacillus cereus]
MKPQSYEINVDTLKSISHSNIEFSQNNLNISELIFNITEDEKEFPLNDTDKIIVYFKKPDKTVVFQDKEIEILDKAKGKIKVLLTSQTLVKSGEVNGEISIERVESGTKKRASTYGFSFKVRSSIASNDSIESTNEFQVFDQLLELGEQDIPAIIASKETAESALVISTENANKLSAPKNVLQFDLANTTASVYSKYGKTKDILFQFRKLTVNQLFAFYRVYTNQNSDPAPKVFPYTDPSVVPIANGQTDWISPYVMKAVNNGDGSSEIFTGGAHSSDNNNTTGNPTARTVNFFVYANGKRVAGTGEYPCDRVDIYVKNQIMSYNTRTVGRYTHEEYVQYTIIGNTISVYVRIMPLEALAWKTYYSAEAVINYYSHVFYPLGQYSTEQIVINAQGNGLETNSGSKIANNTDTTVLSKSGTNEFLEIKIDNTFGLGQRNLVDDNSPLMFSSATKKVYNRLVGETEKMINLNEVYAWKGKYKFYSLD